jgi:hypothetical protein
MTDCLLLPIFLLFLNNSKHFAFSLDVFILSELGELSLDISEGLANDLDKEVVHYIGVVSLERDSVRTDQNGEDTLNFLCFVIFIIVIALATVVSSCLLLFKFILCFVR